MTKTPMVQPAEQGAYPEIKSSNHQQRAFNERAAINAPIQGSAADIIRRVMVRMDAALEDAKLSARMLLQVHDELIFELPEDEVDATIPVVTKVMQEAPFPPFPWRCRYSSMPARQTIGMKRIRQYSDLGLVYTMSICGLCASLHCRGD